MRSVPLLEKFTSILVHDHETTLYHFWTEHAECNVHIIRYLKKNTEESGNKWSSEMGSLLCEMNKARKGLMEQGADKFQEKTIKDYEKRYHNLITDGREQNKKIVHKYAKENENTLLNRLEKYSHNHLLSLYDFAVPFDDNMPERDLRKAKNRQKWQAVFEKKMVMKCTVLF